ncbi:Predicted secretion system X translation initiation factor [Caballeronia glathei]|jgi:hypothetical protein|uniref:Secretion system X translation initiation factor n=1 Tax=Caballeronia glathei TaxID=60547 RepID=A0A069PUD8_9BURK|nr:MULTISPECIES: hypothetical protein [Burkholderiaceae]KDR40941.1 hypothetical protein BG61_21575 [Caballeronia glathei]TCK37129.1 hypothetical protein B0G84_6181 [Paraburkholderia sp. BL8N3]CDY79860.1 Predicted secretion system X translation initiation factor [Caballeronia glathei]
MKRQHIVMAVLFVSCALVLVFSRAPDDTIVEAAPHAAAPSAPAGDRASRSGGAASGAIAIASIHVRDERAAAGTHALFNTRMLAPPLPSAAPDQVNVPPLPDMPLMPFTYIGKQQSAGRWEVYLARGDDTLIVNDQTVIDGTYRVDSISPPTMTLVYLPLKLVQTLDIGSAD